MPVYWADNFNSAAALSVDYYTVTNMTKTAGIGPDGSQAITGTGTNGQKYYAEIHKLVGTVSARKGYAEIDIKPNQAIDQSGSYLIEIHIPDATDTALLGIYSGGSYAGSPDFGDITLYNQSFASIGDATGVFSDGVWGLLGLAWETSSITAGVRNADGWAIVTVNGVEKINVSGLVLGYYNAVTSPLNYWGRVRVAPQGIGDNLYLADVAAAGVATGSVFFG